MSEAPTVGIIGLGIGRAHLRAFQANGCEVVALCQRDEAAARKTAERYGVKGVFTRWQDLIEKARPSIVAITTPPNLHRDITLAAFESGADVLCEKPLAMDRAQAEAMVAAAAQHKRVAMTCFNWRYPLAMQAMHERLARGDVGRVLHVNARWYSATFADEKAAATWRMDSQQAGPGAMGDMGVHIIDLLRWNLGEVARVSARVGVAYPQRSAPGVSRPADTDDHCSLIAELASGALVTASIVRVAHGSGEQALDVFGTQGALSYRLVRSEPRWFEGELRASDGGPMTRVALPALPDTKFTSGDPMEVVGGTLMAPLVGDLLAGIRQRTTPSPSLQDGLRAQAVLDAVLKSAPTGAWVSVEG